MRARSRPRSPRIEEFDRRPVWVAPGDYPWHHGSSLAAIRRILRGGSRKRRSKYTTGWVRSLPGLYFADSVGTAVAAAPTPSRLSVVPTVLHVRDVPLARQELDEDEVRALVHYPNRLKELPPALRRAVRELDRDTKRDRAPGRKEDMRLRRLRAWGVLPQESMRVIGSLPLLVEAVEIDRSWSRPWVDVWARWSES